MPADSAVSRAIREALTELVDSEIGGHQLTDVVEEHLGRSLSPAEIEQVDAASARLAGLVKAATEDSNTIPRHLRIALSRMRRAFEEDEPTRLHTFNETLQPVIDAVIAWGRRGAKMRPDGGA